LLTVLSNKHKPHTSRAPPIQDEPKQLQLELDA